MSNNISGTNGTKLEEVTEPVDLEKGKSIREDKGENDDTIGNHIKLRPIRRLCWRLMATIIILGILGAISALVWYFLGWINLVQLYLVAIVAYIAAGNYKWYYIAFKTAPRDIRAVYRYIRLLFEIKSYQRQGLLVADLFRKNVKKYPHKPCIILEDQEWDFTQVEEYSNKIANIFKGHGYKKGDVIGLFMENKPEYVATWLGLSKLGVVIALINTNQRLNSLVHSLTVANCQAIIFGSELTDAVLDVIGQIESKVSLYQSTRTDKSANDQRFEDLDSLVKGAVPTPPVLDQKIDYNDNLLYIYTSGTTGLPKAAIINNARFIFMAVGISWISCFGRNNILYTPLPLYHTAAGIISMGQMLVYGSTIVIKRKFSASSYFADCVKYKCTIAQYIGEMCRYILAVAPKPTDTTHRLRLVFGNGLRPQIWTEFVRRFNIPRVAELYGATEGNANIVNVDNRVGAIGFVSRIMPSVYPISIIKVDEQTGEPIRDARGLCIECGPNEPGVFIGKIMPGNPSRAFLGYVDEHASQKKIIRDVFHKGDAAFLSGDILVADELGYLYFKDRTGDTFRWKGENVSTSEVEAVLSNLVDYKDVVVYGVEVWGSEGKAGMAAIYDPDGVVDLKKLAEGTRKALPSYARPIFIRILKKMDMTGTFKMKKNDLQKEGFNPNKITESLYYMDSTGYYASLTPEIYEKLNNGTIRI